MITLREPLGPFERAGCLVHGDRPATEILEVSSVLENVTTHTSIRMCAECAAELREVVARRVREEE